MQHQEGPTIDHGQAGPPSLKDLSGFAQDRQRQQEASVVLRRSGSNLLEGLADMAHGAWDLKEQNQSLLDVPDGSFQHGQHRDCAPQEIPINHEFLPLRLRARLSWRQGVCCGLEHPVPHVVKDLAGDVVEASQLGRASPLALRNRGQHLNRQRQAN